MRRVTTAIGSLFLSVIFASVAFSDALAQGRSDSSRFNSQDTLLTEIRLTHEGVTAIDTGGHRWVYDFDKNSFVPDKETPATAGRSDIRRRREAVPDAVEVRCTQLKEVKPLQKTVLVGYDEYIEGGVIAYGRVVVKGWVKGDVQSINGKVLVTESGQVDGDIKAPEIVVNEGGMVLGSQIESDALEFTGEVLRRPFSADGIIVVLCFVMFFLVASFLLLSLFPRQQEALEAAMFDYKTKSFLLGFLSILLIWLPIGLLAITIVGIIVIPFVPVLYVVAMTAGVISFGKRVGRYVLARVTRADHGNMFETFVGLGVFMSLWMLVALLLGTGNDESASFGFGIFLLVMAIIISTFPICAGLGGALLTRLGMRQYRPSTRGDMMRGSGAPAPAPPPIPLMPDMVMPPPRSSLIDIPRPSRPEDGGTDKPDIDPRPPLPSNG